MGFADLIDAVRKSTYSASPIRNQNPYGQLGSFLSHCSGFNSLTRALFLLITENRLNPGNIF